MPVGNTWPPRQRLCRAVSAALGAALAPAAAHALPAGGQVSAGQAAIATGTGSVTVTQASSHAVLDWSSFNIGSGQQVDFSQPSASSIALNRIHDSQPSAIDGQLNANGQVWLLNPNGVMFGPGAQVNVGGLLATTSNISNSDFMAGNYNFTPGGIPTASVSNAGTITAADTGLVALVAPQVQNSGVINARLGKVALASGDSFTLDLYGDGLIDLGVSDSVAKQLVANSGTIQADGGQVQLTAAAASNAVSGVINMSGVIQARTLDDLTGGVSIYAQGSNAVPNNDAALKGVKSGESTVLVSGTIDASGYGAGQKGGTVQVLGDQVGLTSGSLIDVSGDAGGGTVRVGGDFHGADTTPTAWAAVMQTGATIKADAVTDGNGGNVTLWADNYTNFTGSIWARGGISGGNGGFVETSGKQILDMSGLVDASAPWGKAGTWLMDPEDVTISAGVDSDITGNPSFVPGGNQATASLNVNDIDMALNAGTNVSITTGGDAQNGPNGGSITVSSPISATTGTGGATGSLTLSSYQNIAINSPITLGGAGVTGGNLLLDADNHNNGSGCIDIAAAISTNGGNITLGGGSGTITAGSGYAVGNSGQAYGVYINNVAVNAGDGNIVANGEGYNSSGNGNSGIYVDGGSAALETTGTGTITLSGIGQGTGDSGSDIGVYAYDGGIISTVNGNLTITGVGGGAGSGVNNIGIRINSGSAPGVLTTGGGNITLTGTGGGAGDSGNSNWGILAMGANAILASGSGNITLNGTGGGAGGIGQQQYGVFIYTGGSVAASGGNIAITGIAGNSSGNFDYGIDINGGSVSTTGSGTITLAGTGQGTGNSNNSYGVYLLGGSAITAVNGDLTVTGTGSEGISVRNSGSAIKTTGSGNISITGSDSANSGYSDWGVDLESSGSIQAAGSGAITVIGSGSGSGTGWNGGVWVASGAAIMGNGGNMTITGTAGSNGGNSNQGIAVNGGTISNAGSGTLTLSGTGAGNTNSGSDDGVYVTNNTTGGIISTVNGDLAVTGGGGGAGTGGSNDGVYVQGTGSAIETTGSGNLSITGMGGNGSGNFDIGIYAQNLNNIEATGSGNITLTGTGGGTGDNTTGVNVNGSVTANGGNIAITGTGGYGNSKNYGVSLNGTHGTGNGMVSTTGNGTITITGIARGADSTGSDYGIYIWGGGGTNGGGATAVNGNISVTGYGGDNGGSGSGNYGVYIAQSTTGSNFVTTGSGNIIVNGKGGNSSGGGNYGIDLAMPNGLQAAAGGTVTAVAHASDIFLDTAGSVYSNAFDTAITLATRNGGDFLNENGATALSAPNGRWLIYSTSPFADDFDGLTARFTRFNCAYGGTCPAVPGRGNGLLFSESMNSIIPASITIADATLASITAPRARQELSSQGFGDSSTSVLAMYCKSVDGVPVCYPM